MKILLTGAAGFIGMHTSSRLPARGDEVVGADKLNDDYDVSLKVADTVAASAITSARVREPSSFSACCEPSASSARTPREATVAKAA